MRLIDADYFVEFLKGMYERAGWNSREIHMSLADVISNLDNVPTVTDSCQWTPVTEKLPVLTDDEDNEFLVTIKMTRSTREPMYYVIIASYSENLLSLDEFDFPGEDRPGWYGYDPEEGFFDIEHNIGNFKREVVAWAPVPKPYGKEN